jgi:polysaccharide export outer membrane protein
LDPAPQLSSEHSTSSLDCFSEVQEFARAKLEDIRQQNQATNWRKQMRSANSELQWRLVFIAVISAGLLNGAERVAGQDSLPAAPSTYTLGPNDQTSFWGIDVDEIVNKQFRIGPEGYVSLPMVGRLRAAGLTIRQFEETLNEQLSTYIREPHVVVTITEFRSQSVSVLGAVRSPGTYQLQGRKTVVEMISLAGGFREDSGNTVKIDRELEWGKIPLSNASIDPLGKFSVAEVRIKEILEAKSPEDNTLMMPHDVIVVPRGELVYVIGEVNKAGGFILTERSNMSVLQALSLDEGSQRTADTRHAKILRLEPGQEQRREIAVNLPRRLPGLGRRDRNGLPAGAASTLLGAQDARHPRTRAPPRLPP